MGQGQAVGGLGAGEAACPRSGREPGAVGQARGGGGKFSWLQPPAGQEPGRGIFSVAGRKEGGRRGLQAGQAGWEYS